MRRWQLRDERLKGAVGALFVQAALGAALVWGLAVRMPAISFDDPLKAFDLSLPTPPTPAPEAVPPPPQDVAEAPSPAPRAPQPEGAASPPNLRGKASEIVAPTPVVPLPVPTPVAPAEAPGTGTDRTTGAADVPGFGTGAGGTGSGSGSGAGGAGPGGGGGGGIGRNSPPRRIGGSLRNSDYPREAWEPGIGGTVAVRYTVGTNGRVTNCRILRSSGSDALDSLTCRLIEQRFRFEPSREPGGRPVPADVVENHSWIIEQLPPEPRRR